MLEFNAGTHLEGDDGSDRWIFKNIIITIKQHHYMNCDSCQITR